MQTVFACLSNAHNRDLLIVAAFTCVIGVFGSFCVAHHAARSDGATKVWFATAGVVAAGSTAWATHMIALLAFSPGMPDGFELFRTVASLILGVIGIAAGMGLSIGERRRSRRFLGGTVLGLGIVALHYVGQAGYVVRGVAEYDPSLVFGSIAASLPIFGLALAVSGERNRRLRPLATPLLLAAIATLHSLGMGSLRLTFDPRVQFPAFTFAPETVAPVVAVVCIGIFCVAVVGFWFAVQAELRRRREQRRFGELANMGLEGLAVCDQGVIVVANDSLERLSGRKRKQLIGLDLDTLLPAVDIASLEELSEIDAELVDANGKSVAVRLVKSTVRLGLRPQTIVAFRDQRQRLESEEKIHRLAFSDHLTGLANRTRFIELLSTSAENSGTRDRGFTVLLIDLDGFKSVNDAFGHKWGDAVLKVVADRLRGLAEPEHLAARLGGDEFAVLVSQRLEVEEAFALGSRIIASIEEEIQFNSDVVRISASVGLIVSSDDSKDTSHILEDADLALYEAKSAGRGCVRVFAAAMRETVDERAALLSELELAWASGEFELYYQPQVRLSDGELVGAEALIRWNHPTRGVLAPVFFIDALQSSPLAVPVGRWVLQKACEQAAAWRQARIEELRIGVNLFPAQIRSAGFVDVVRAILEQSGLPPRALEIEVTENIVLRNESDTLEHISSLREIGVGIAFDDFGTGFASLTMLKRVCLDRLKIDRSFVQSVDSDRRDQAIVDAVARMADGCGLSVIAEGIETQAQADFMKNYASEGQGYLYGRPMTAGDFETKFFYTEQLSAVAA